MQITQLPNGQTCLLRDPSQVSERRRRPFLDALGRALPTEDMDGMTEQQVGLLMLRSGQMSAMSEANDLLILALVESWTLAGPSGERLPITQDALLDLPGETYDALRTAVAPYTWKVLPKSYEPNPKDPASLTSAETPTVPSGD